MHALPRTPRAIAIHIAALALLTAGTTGSANAQVKLDAAYAITAAHISVGSVTASVDIGDGAYTMVMSGRASGMARALASGDGKFTAHGHLQDGRPAPDDFSATSTSEDDKLDVRMSFDGGAVKELTATEPPPSKDRVPVTADHQQNVTDPLTALLIPASPDGDGVSKAACDRTLPIFDGRRRYDLKLAFKRIDRVKADKGYAGPAVVCAVTFQPIAGHRASSPTIKFLGDGREIEMAFAPVAGTALLAPFRIAITNMLGNIIVQANRFDVQARSSTRASATTGETVR